MHDWRLGRTGIAAAALALVAAADALAETTRVGFVGLRHGHAWRQLADVSKIAEAEFVGVAESMPALVEEARKVQPDAHFASDYRTFVRERKPEIVWAFVKNSRHAEMVEFLAPLGVHVIFEKPLAGSYADALRIRELASAHGIQVMTNYQMAWWPANHEMRRQAAAGRVGRVWRLHGIVGNAGPVPRDARRKVFFDWLTDPVANGGGALVDFGIYSAMWAVWHLGPPNSVYAITKHLQPDRFPKVEDSGVMVLSYPDAVGVFEAAWNLPRGFQQLEAFGRDGSLRLERNTLTLQEGRKDPVALDAPQLNAAASHPIRYMIDRVRSGQPLEHITALDLNVGAVQVLEAAKRSAREGRAIALPLKSTSETR